MKKTLITAVAAVTLATALPANADHSISHTPWKVVVRMNSGQTVVVEEDLTRNDATSVVNSLADANADGRFYRVQDFNSTDFNTRGKERWINPRNISVVRAVK